MAHGMVKTFTLCGENFILITDICRLILMAE